MALLTLHIEALAPLAFPERKPGIQFNASLPYVPGPALFGALGQQLGPAGFNANLFRDLRCHNAYPARADDAWVRPLPMTAIKPKGVEKVQPHDSIYARVAWERQQPAALIYAPTDDDGRPWEGAGTLFYTLTPKGVADRAVQQRVLTRVAINRARGTAQDGRIYSPLVLSEVDWEQAETDGEGETKRKMPTRFLGSLVVPDAAVEPIRRALEAITHLGARQTTGLGAVCIAPSADVEPADDADALLRRVEVMTRRFQEQVARYEKLGGVPWVIPAASIFTVNLLADTILLEQGWLPTQELSAELLEEATGVKASLLRSFTTTKTIGGYHTLWQRPKPAEVAVTMGGLYVFQADAPLTRDECARLAWLQLDGIGERRAEGFGQVRICDDFHLFDWGNHEHP